MAREGATHHESDSTWQLIVLGGEERRTLPSPRAGRDRPSLLTLPLDSNTLLDAFDCSRARLEVRFCTLGAKAREKGEEKGRAEEHRLTLILQLQLLLPQAEEVPSQSLANRIERGYLLVDFGDFAVEQGL